jgi:hypothetical protein
MKGVLDYKAELNVIKQNILDDIKDIMGEELVHEFREDVIVHYIDGDVASTEKLRWIDIEEGINFSFEDDYDEYIIGGKDLYRLDVESLLGVRTALITELREEKKKHIINLVKQNDGKVVFSSGLFIDGTYKINSISLDNDGIALLSISFMDGVAVENLNALSLDGLTKLEAMIKDETEEEFTITASNVLSRQIKVKASSYDKAVELVKLILKQNPLNEDDGTGTQFY